MIPELEGWTEVYASLGADISHHIVLSFCIMTVLCRLLYHDEETHLPVIAFAFLPPSVEA